MLVTHTHAKDHRRKLGSKSGGALTMVSKECEPITGVWGQIPSGVQGQSPWSGDKAPGQGGEAP